MLAPVVMHNFEGEYSRSPVCTALFQVLLSPSKLVLICLQTSSASSMQTTNNSNLHVENKAKNHKEFSRFRLPIHWGIYFFPERVEVVRGCQLLSRPARQRVQQHKAALIWIGERAHKSTDVGWHREELICWDCG